MHGLLVAGPVLVGVGGGGHAANAVNITRVAGDKNAAPAGAAVVKSLILNLLNSITNSPVHFISGDAHQKVDLKWVR